MKKKILSIAMLTASVVAINEDVRAQQSMVFGVEGTPQMSWLYNQDDMDNDAFKNVNTVNASFGVSWQYGFTKRVGVGVNGLYSFQGQRFKLAEVERNKKLEYVKIPVMLVYTSDINADIMFIGKIGPQLGLLVNAEITDKDDIGIITDYSSAYQDYDLGGVVYGGIGFKLGEDLLFDVSLKADYGFTDAENKDYARNINNPAAIINGNGSGMSNRAITNNVTAGLSLGLRYIIKYE